MRTAQFRRRSKGFPCTTGRTPASIPPVSRTNDFRFGHAGRSRNVWASLLLARCVGVALTRLTNKYLTDRTGSSAGSTNSIEKKLRGKRGGGGEKKNKRSQPVTSRSSRRLHWSHDLFNVFDALCTRSIGASCVSRTRDRSIRFEPLGSAAAGIYSSVSRTLYTLCARATRIVVGRVPGDFVFHSWAKDTFAHDRERVAEYRRAGQQRNFVRRRRRDRERRDRESGIIRRETVPGAHENILEIRRRRRRR